MKVLIAGAHRGVRDTLRDSLIWHGVQVVGTASDGLEAIEKARRLSPEVIILDFHMPRCGGLEAARLIRSAMPRARIVMLTTWDEKAYARAAVACGAIGCFEKTVPTRDLITAMEYGKRCELSLADLQRAPGSGARERRKREDR